MKLRTLFMGKMKHITAAEDRRLKDSTITLKLYHKNTLIQFETLPLSVEAKLLDAKGVNHSQIIIK